MDKLTIKLIGKKDRHGKDYYTSTCHAPALVSLENTVFHVFPFEKEDNAEDFGADLVIRFHDKKDKIRDEDVEVDRDDSKKR